MKVDSDHKIIIMPKLGIVCCCQHNYDVYVNDWIELLLINNQV